MLYEASIPRLVFALYLYIEAKAATRSLKQDFKTKLEQSVLQQERDILAIPTKLLPLQSPFVDLRSIMLDTLRDQTRRILCNLNIPIDYDSLCALVQEENISRMVATVPCCILLAQQPWTLLQMILSALAISLILSLLYLFLKNKNCQWLRNKMIMSTSLLVLTEAMLWKNAPFSVYLSLVDVALYTIALSLFALVELFIFSHNEYDFSHNQSNVGKKTMSQAVVNRIANTLFEEDDELSQGYAVLTIKEEDPNQVTVMLLRHNNCLAKLLRVESQDITLSQKLLDGLRLSESAEQIEDLRVVLTNAYSKWQRYEQSDQENNQDETLPQLVSSIFVNIDNQKFFVSARLLCKQQPLMLVKVFQKLEEKSVYIKSEARRQSSSNDKLTMIRKPSFPRFSLVAGLNHSQLIGDEMKMSRSDGGFARRNAQVLGNSSSQTSDNMHLSIEANNNVPQQSASVGSLDSMSEIDTYVISFLAQEASNASSRRGSLILGSIMTHLDSIDEERSEPVIRNKELAEFTEQNNVNFTNPMRQTIRNTKVDKTVSYTSSSLESEQALFGEKSSRSSRGQKLRMRLEIERHAPMCQEFQKSLTAKTETLHAGTSKDRLNNLVAPTFPYMEPAEAQQDNNNQCCISDKAQKSSLCSNNNVLQKFHLTDPSPGKRQIHSPKICLEQLSKFIKSSSSISQTFVKQQLQNGRMLTPKPNFFSHPLKKAQFLTSVSAVGRLPSRTDISVFKPLSRLGLQQTNQSFPQSQKRSQKNQQIDKDIFVYKIIHELRAPTDSLVQGIKEIATQLAMDSLVQTDKNLVIQTSKKLQYVCQPRVNRAVAYLEYAVKQSPSRKIQSRDSSSPSNPSVQKNRLKMKSTQHIMSEEQKLQFNLRSLQQQFWSIDIKKIQTFKSNDSSPKVNERQNPLIDLDKDVAVQQAKNSSSSESDKSEMESSNDAEDSVGEELNANLVQLKTVKKLQKKAMRRQSVKEIVQRKIADADGDKSEGYRSRSLAVDYLIYNSENRKSKDNQGDVSLKRSQSVLAGNVLHMIDRMKEESAKSRISKDSNRSEIPRLNQILSQPKDKEDSALIIVRSQPIKGSKNKELARLSKLSIDKREGLSVEKGQTDKLREQVKNLPRIHLAQELSPLANKQSPNQSRSIIEPDLKKSLGSPSVTQEVYLGRRIQHSIKVILQERYYLSQLANNLLSLNQNVRSKLANMSEETEMMMTLLRDLMNQAALANNTFAMVNEYFDCSNLIKKCFRIVAIQAQLKDVTLQGPIILAPLDRFYFHQLWSDQRRYSQFIINFLTNAIKFTPPAGEVSVILKVISVTELTSSNTKTDKKSSRLSGEEALKSNKQTFEPVPAENLSQEEIQSHNEFCERMVCFQMIFRDTGCGISVERRKNLFFNFKKLQETQDCNKLGVGLGLSICKEIILAQGGSVVIESEPGKGSDFIINLKAKCKIDMARLRKAQQQIDIYGFETPSNEASNEWSRSGKSQGVPDKDDCDPSPDSYVSSYSDSNPSGSIDIDFNKALLQRSQTFSELVEQYSQEKNNFSCTGNKDSLGQLQNNDQRQDQHKNKTLKRRDSKREFRSLHTIYENDSDEACSKRQPTRCLIANDNPFLLVTFQEVLQQQFKIVDTAVNGRAALDLVLAHEPNYYDAIMLDISMPIMDGMEVCIKILEYFNQIQIPLRAQNNSVSLQNDDDDAFESDFLAHQRDIQSVPESPKRAIPFIYALTQETEPQIIARINSTGFKDIYHMLCPTTLQQILANANMEYKPAISGMAAYSSEMFQSQYLESTPSSNSNNSDVQNNASNSPVENDDKYDGR